MSQGGAAFWRNLHRNGTGNPLTLHAACPVLEGYKWGESNISITSYHLNDND